MCVAILVDKVLATRVHFVFKSEQFIVIRVGNLLLVNVYMPCQSSDNYEDVYAETLANIINVTLDLHNCSFIIAGDFNCNMNVKSFLVKHH